MHPRDALYFHPHAFAIIQEHHQNAEVIIIGDFNARMGNLSTLNRPDEKVEYTNNPDITMNSNGRDLISLCNAHNMLPINNLQITI